jgi:predicted RNA binding protein YcfA (HicA-like mRNA interferase family)
MPRKVRQLIAEIRRAGFILLPRRGKGSHMIWEHPASGTRLTLSGHTGADADDYQERDVREAIAKVRRLEHHQEA